MIADQYRTFDHGHTASFVIDAQRDLIVMSCKLCGAYTKEAFQLGQPLPAGFKGIEHSESCPLLGTAKPV